MRVGIRRPWSLGRRRKPSRSRQPSLQTRDLSLHKPCSGETQSVLVSLNYVVLFEVLHCDRPSKCVSVQIRFERCACISFLLLEETQWRKVADCGCRQIRTTVGKNATLFTALHSKGSPIQKSKSRTPLVHDTWLKVFAQDLKCIIRPAACRCITLLSSLEDLYEQPGCIIKFADTMTWVSPVIAQFASFTSPFVKCERKRSHSYRRHFAKAIMSTSWYPRLDPCNVATDLKLKPMKNAISFAGDGIFNPANDGTAGLSNDVVAWMKILIQYLTSEENFIQWIVLLTLCQNSWSLAARYGSVLSFGSKCCKWD